MSENLRISEKIPFMFLAYTTKGTFEDMNFILPTGCAHSFTFLRHENKIHIFTLLFNVCFSIMHHNKTFPNCFIMAYSKEYVIRSLDHCTGSVVSHVFVVATVAHCVLMVEEEGM